MFFRANCMPVRLGTRVTMQNKSVCFQKNHMFFRVDSMMVFLHTDFTMQTVLAHHFGDPRDSQMMLRVSSVIIEHHTSL